MEAKAVSIRTHGLTDKEIDEFVKPLRGVLKKHHRELDAESFRAFIESGVYEREYLRFVRGAQEADRGMAVRTAFVDARPLDQWCKDRVVQIDKATRAAMPKRADGEALLYFFKIRKDVTCDELMREYEFRGFSPANPFQLMALNTAEPDFADTHPNVTVWQDGAGQWHRAAFCKLEHLRSAFLAPVETMLTDLAWYAGVRA